MDLVRHLRVGLALILATLSLSHPELLYSQVRKTDDPLPLKTSAVFESAGYRGRVLAAEADIGEVVCGKRYSLTIAFSNDSERDIEFDRVSANHSHRPFEINTNVIRADDTAEGRLEFEVPSSYQLPSIRIGVKFLKNGEVVARSSFEAYLRENLQFVQSGATFETSDDGFQEKTFRFLYGKPLSQFEVFVPEELNRLINVKLATHATQFGTVTISAVEDFFMIEESVGGKITVKAKGHEKKTELFVHLYQRLPVKISPEILLFNSTGDDGSFQASAMIRTNDAIEIDDLRLSLEGLDASLSVKTLNEQIARLTITVDEKAFGENTSGDLLWKARYRTSEFPLRSKWQK